MIAIVDYGVGNLFSLKSSFARVGAETVVTGDANELARADRIVLPGVGAFADAAEKLRRSGLDRTVVEQTQNGKPLLGVCLGMQLLFDHSEEGGGHPGLGVLPGQVKRFPADMPAGEQPGARMYKVPHVGWNDCQPTNEHFFFTHSYYVEAGVPEDVMWTCRYGRIEFPAAINRGNVFGAQFHPQKSQWSGLRFLRSFILGGRG